MLMLPPLPDMEDPVPIVIDPLDRKLEVPVLSTNDPLDPNVPAFDVARRNDPLLVDVPIPLTNLILPPVALDDFPAEKKRPPPKPLVPEPTER